MWLLWLVNCIWAFFSWFMYILLKTLQFFILISLVLESEHWTCNFYFLFFISFNTNLDVGDYSLTILVVSLNLLEFRSKNLFSSFFSLFSIKTLWLAWNLNHLKFFAPFELHHSFWNLKGLLKFFLFFFSAFLLKNF